MSTAGTGNSTEPLLWRELGRPARNQEQNLKGKGGENSLQTEARAPENSANTSELGQDHSNPFCLVDLLPTQLETFRRGSWHNPLPCESTYNTSRIPKAARSNQAACGSQAELPIDSTPTGYLGLVSGLGSLSIYYVHLPSRLGAPRGQTPGPIHL